MTVLTGPPTPEQFEQAVKAELPERWHADFSLKRLKNKAVIGRMMGAIEFQESMVSGLIMSMADFERYSDLIHAELAKEKLTLDERLKLIQLGLMAAERRVRAVSAVSDLMTAIQKEREPRIGETRKLRNTPPDFSQSVTVVMNDQPKTIDILQKDQAVRREATQTTGG